MIIYTVIYKIIFIYLDYTIFLLINQAVKIICYEVEL